MKNYTSPIIRQEKLPKSFGIVQLSKSEGEFNHFPKGVKTSLMVKQGFAFALPSFVIKLRIRVFGNLAGFMVYSSRNPTKIHQKFTK